MEKINTSTLNAFLGQLIDLKEGFLNEIVIKRGDNADLLAGIIRNEIENQKILSESEKDNGRVEELRAEEMAAESLRPEIKSW